MNSNYRIIDQTGGGATNDIYAESLEAAIEAGREWIEAGEWSSENGTYRTIELKCCVKEIVRGEDGEIDEDATREEFGHDCSGTYSDELPECKAEANDEDADDQGHVWRSPFSLVGGIRENPGVWSNGGTRSTTKQVCRCCGMYRTEVDPGGQRNPDEALCTITLEPRDDDSEAWLKETNEEEGWLPEWLVAFLGCAPTVRMTEEKAREWVDALEEGEDPDAEDLEHAFAAIFGRRADDTDRAAGLLSLMA